MFKTIKEFFNRIFHKKEVKQITSSSDIKEPEKKEDLRSSLVNMEKENKINKTNKEIEEKKKISNRLEVPIRDEYESIYPDQNINMKLD